MDTHLATSEVKEMIYPDCITKNRPYKMIHNTPMHKIPYTDSYAYNATDVAAHALGGSKEAQSWIRLNMESDGAFLHHYDDIYYGQKSGWTSAVSQALGAMALMESRDYDRAWLALKYMLDNHTRCGIIYEKADKLILNGWMYGILALDQFYQDTLDRDALKLCQNCTQKLQALFPQFIMPNGWTRYDETGIPATPFYHKVHKELLFELWMLDELKQIEHARFPIISRNFRLIMKHNYKLPVILWRKRQWLA